jgi:hypothetical protein
MTMPFRRAAACAAAAALSACATLPPLVEGGPPFDLPPSLVDEAGIAAIRVEGAPWVLDRYAETRGDHDIHADRTDPTYRRDPLSDLNFEDDVGTEIGEELRRCADGPRLLEARVLIADLIYDDRLRSLVDGRGADLIGGVVELADPATGEIVGRYEVRAGTNSGGLLTRIVTDRTSNLAEEFGRALCMQAFGRNPRPPAIQNSTRG